MLSSIFDSDENVDILVNRFIKKLDGCVANSFRKKRVTRKKKDQTKMHFNKIRLLKGKHDQDSKKELYENYKALAQITENYFHKVKDNKGGMNAKQLWKIKSKLCPNKKDSPTAMLDPKGNLFTSNKGIEELAVEFYLKKI